jgi:hypothetical protein
MFKTADGGRLFVVVEDQAGTWVACDVTDGVLQTYATHEEALEEAIRIMSWLGCEDFNSWFPVHLEDAELGDNVRLIALPE